MKHSLKDEVKFLHIGCGLNAPKSWLNIDASPSLRISRFPVVGSVASKLLNFPEWPTQAKYGNIVLGLNAQKEYCDLVFAAHVLEHLSLNDFHVALKNIFYYLKPGGFLRIIVPDLEVFAKSYISSKRDQSSQDQASISFMQDTLLGVKSTRSSYFSRLKEAFSNSKHQWMWDQESLVKAVKDHSFSVVRPCVYGDWSDERFSEVEREKDYRFAVGIEAQK
jgi:hypothetical protein